MTGLRLFGRPGEDSAVVASMDKLTEGVKAAEGRYGGGRARGEINRLNKAGLWFLEGPVQNWVGIMIIANVYSVWGR